MVRHYDKYTTLLEKLIENDDHPNQQALRQVQDHIYNLYRNQDELEERVQVLEQKIQVSEQKTQVSEQKIEVLGQQMCAMEAHMKKMPVVVGPQGGSGGNNDDNNDDEDDAVTVAPQDTTTTTTTSTGNSGLGDGVDFMWVIKFNKCITTLQNKFRISQAKHHVDALKKKEG